MKGNPSLILEINSAVNADVISASLAQNVSSVMDLYHNKKDDIRMTGRTFSILLHGLQNNKSRAKLKFDLGRKHAVFQFKAVKRTVLNANMLSEECFRASAAALTVCKSFLDSAGKDPIGINPSGKPASLEKGFLDSNMLNLARKQDRFMKILLPKDPRSMEKRKLLFIGKTILNFVHASLYISWERSRAKMF